MSNQEPSQPLSQSIRPLAAFAPGEGAVITAFMGGRKLQERLVALGLFPGQRLTVCQNNGSSLIIRLNGNRLALGRGLSQKILAIHSTYHCQSLEDCQCPAKVGKNKD